MTFYTKKAWALVMAMACTLAAAAQGNNSGMGGDDGNTESLAGRIAKLEKKNDAFNLYFNYSASMQATHDSRTGAWTSRFAAKQLRMEIKGNLTDRLFYRLRHRLNKADDARGEDNFSKATDIMMAGYRLSPKWTVQAGKMVQIWGGFEFDENPLYIYQFSDMCDNIDPFQAGVVASFRPVPTQEIAIEVSDASNGKLKEDYGDGAVVVLDRDAPARELVQANHPLTYIVNWNGSFADGRFNTRWAWGIQTQARHRYSRMLTLGQQLCLPHLQWYADYTGTWDDLDRFRIATADLAPAATGADGTPLQHVYYGKVHYNSVVTKANWQFAARWNLMLKGMYETASVSRSEQLKNYRTSYGYMGSVEYYPVRQQDLRLFLAFVGRRYNFTGRSGLDSYGTQRIELGFMYRIKAY